MNEIDKIEIDPIDQFEYKYNDAILDFYYDLKNRIPYLLGKMNFSDLMSFIIELKFKTKYQTKYLKSTIVFDQEFNDEINSLLYVINKQLHFNIRHDKWVDFCYTFS
jgi:hypothetical protein